MKKQSKLLLILILILFGVNYPFLDSYLEAQFGEQREFGIVERVVDGDTIIINGTSIRLLGINTPERGEKYYLEAKEFLEKIILNKTIELKFGKEKYDRYQRILAYVFYKNANVNLELVDEGYANYYFPSGKDSYYDKFVRAWEHCLENGKYLCEKSKESCIKLAKFDYKSEIIVLENKCSRAVDLEGWEIKDEGRKKFIFENFILPGKDVIPIILGEGNNNKNTLYWPGETYVWTNSGDTMFLRDREGKLVLWEGY
ncbi:hypothetical protein HN832_04490 [archaeon]|jgi:micrococcal nuclease|nr:hypothetical protein [archaeon]MBT4373349.1 hypothetical protein [archaeon]MBT4531797.1 hypothetical protein [archaeon]MBT7001464.1 hypothetical protein [archaeon]MBT7282644.1 hypothetical protein [archaeon]